VLVFPVVGPLGTVGVEIVSAVVAKLATTFFGPFIVMEAGLVDPERSPDQLEKV
jgi:hypothetical protein